MSRSARPRSRPAILRTAKEVEAIVHAGVPSAAEQGVSVVEITPDGAVLTAPADSRSVRPGGTVSGPAMMGLADAAMWAAILARVDEGAMAVTSEMSIRFLRRPPLGGLVARTEIVRFGRSQVVMEVRLFVGDESEPVALVVGTYALPRAPA